MKKREWQGDNRDDGGEGWERGWWNKTAQALVHLCFHQSPRSSGLGADLGERRAPSSLLILRKVCRRDMTGAPQGGEL